MKQDIQKLVLQAIGEVPDLADVEFAPTATLVERARDPKHGHFATNVAMQLAKPARKNPREIAELIRAQIPTGELVAAVDIAGPGFINFKLADNAFHQLIEQVLQEGENYGHQKKRNLPKVLLEFVSANPTGPLHVGHGRHAAYGATLGNILEAAGFDVTREYYVNDAGRQMDILAVSVLLRALEAHGTTIDFPAAGYKGDYIRDIAAAIELPDFDADALFKDSANDDQEVEIGKLISNAEELLGSDGFFQLRRRSLESILEDIKDDLSEFGVEFDRWYSEQSLTDEARIDAALKVLAERDVLYEKDGATWFRATDYDDEKDRVVVRDNGKKTYFASDIAYHFDKRERGFDHLLDVLGSDHHGYIARVRAGLQAMGYEGDSLEVALMQFVTLYRGEEKIQMSTRSGEFVTLRALREEVGNDAARFFYVTRSNDQHLDFDLELAKSHSNDNPVYYIQYAHARVASVFRQVDEKSLAYDRAKAVSSLGALDESHERALMTTLSRYPEVIELSATNRAPQTLVHYLRDIATDLHSYYNAHTFIVDDENVRNARLALIEAAQIVIASGLRLLGVSAPESM